MDLNNPSTGGVIRTLAETKAVNGLHVIGTYGLLKWGAEQSSAG